MPSECAAVGCSEKLTKEFSFYAFPFKKKNEARKRQWQMAMNQWDLATKKWEPKHHDVLCSKRHVCFHSDQYFYIPQENVNLSNEQHYVKLYLCNGVVEPRRRTGHRQRSQ